MTHPRRRSVVRTLAALTAGAGLLAGATVAQADTREDLVEQREQVAAEQEELEASLEGVDTELADIYVRLEKANERLPEAEAALAEAEDRLAAAEREKQQVTDRLVLAEAEAESLAGEISAAQDEITGSQDALGELARDTYRGGSSMGSLRVVLDASSTEEFMRQYTVLDTAVRAQTSVIDALEDAAAVSRNREARQQAVAERIAELKDEADAAVVDADAAREEAEARAEEIREIKRTQEELADELEGRRGVIEDDLSQAQATDTELAEEIARIDAENRRKEEEQEAERQAQQEREARAERESRADRDADAASRGGAGTTSRPGGTDGLAFATPVPNPLWVTSPYGMREHPLAGIWWMHDGVDLS
ncbi:hypothetical protein PU560_15280, partial [Georgenia sp. 10Sc9-8]|nr:hypothetical protein [Georgenia halotolerans]